MKHSKKNKTSKRKRGGVGELNIGPVNDDDFHQDGGPMMLNELQHEGVGADNDGGPMMLDELNVEDDGEDTLPDDITVFTNGTDSPLNQSFVSDANEENAYNTDGETDTEMYGGRKKNKTHKKREQLRSSDLKYCPHMPLDIGKYAKIDKSKPLTLKWKGTKYRFYTCCEMCSKRMLELAKTNPKKFEQTYIYKIEKRDMYLKHKETQKVVQIAKEIVGKTKNQNKTKRKTKKTKKTKNTRKKMKGGNQMFGRGYGANCNDPNFSIANTNMLKLFPYKPT